MFIFPNTCMLHAKSLQFSSVQFSCSVVSDSMDCSKPVHDQSLTNSQSLLKLMSIELDGCHPSISFSVILFSCLPSFPASGSFQMSQLFTSNDQSTGASDSASVLPMNIQDSFRIDWFGLLAVQGTLKSLLHATVQKHPFFGAQPSLWSNSHIHTWWLEKP